ncbi:unnamed protein product, partial [Musa hybrid cultivar]
PTSKGAENRDHALQSLSIHLLPDGPACHKIYTMKTRSGGVEREKQGRMRMEGKRKRERKKDRCLQR